jgi:signal transduction histidine kinase
MGMQLRILIVEDEPADAILAERALRQAGLAPEIRRVETAAEFLRALEEFRPDLILCDYNLPRFDGLSALRLAKERAPLTPFLIITGAINEEVAIACMKAGATDYILKDHLSRAGPAVQAALEQRRTLEEKMRAEEELRASRETLRRLSAHLQTAREEERTAIAREIHDELGQALTALKMEVACLDRDPQALAARKDSALALIDATIRSVQRLCTELRPGILDDFGLEAAVEWQVQEFGRRSGLDCTLAVDHPEKRLDRQRQTALFRILQEALTNVSRHAGASRVAVSLGVDGECSVLEVRDDGRGLGAAERANPKSFGLIGMEERIRAFGGSLEILSAPGTGTTVVARLARESTEKPR